MTNGFLIVLSAPSGGGKSTLIQELLKGMPEILYSVSMTTRPPRQGEKNGQDYFFVSENEFQIKREADELIEFAQVHGHWYGTPRKFIEDQLGLGHEILLDVDVQGGRKIKKIFSDSALIFIAPPSLAVLESRLRGRRQDDEITIQKRLRAAQSELEAAQDYDYLVLNEQFDQAVRQLQSVIVAERLKMHRIQYAVTPLNKEAN